MKYLLNDKPYLEVQELHEFFFLSLFWEYRKNKRYFYRNTTTKAIQWEYPNVDDKGKDVEGGGEEMDLCDTPPHLSPSEAEKAAGMENALILNKITDFYFGIMPF